MSDKNIGSLPAAASIEDDSLLVAEQQGEAVHFTGKQLKDYAKSGVDALVAAAAAAADRAETAAGSVEDVAADAQAAKAAAAAAAASQAAAANSEQGAAAAKNAASGSASAAKAQADRATSAAQTAATTAAQQAAGQAASQVSSQLRAEVQSLVNEAERSAAIAQSAAKTAAEDAVEAAESDIVGYVSAAQTAKDAAEKARDEAQAAVGGNFMDKGIYDPQGKATDIFAYVDEKTASAPDATFVGEKSGEIIQIDSLYNAPVQGVSVKDGSAVTSVTVWGKNLMHRDYDRAVTSIGVTAEWDPETQEFVLNGTTTSGGDIKLCDPFDIRWIPGENYIVTVQQTGGTAILGSYTGTTYAWGIFQNNAARYVRGTTGNTAFTPTYQFTAKAYELDAGKYNILYFQCWAKGTVFDNYRVKIQIEKGSAATEWEPYRGVSATIENAHTLMLEKGLNYIASTPQKEISVRYLVDANEYLKTMQIGADRVEFSDGATLQQKFDGGTLKGKDATINGVNAMTVRGGDGIEAAMSGSTLTIKAKTVEEWTFTVEGEDGVDTTVTKKVVLV